MRYLRYFCFSLFLIICFSLSVYAEDTCDSKKLEQLKKQADVVTAVSQFDEESEKMGNFSSNLVTVYGLSEGLYATNKAHTVVFSYNDAEDGSITRVIDSDYGVLNVYSSECPDKILKTINLELKKINKYYGYDECADFKDKVEICSKFYDADNLSYGEFLKKVEEYKENGVNSLTGKFDFTSFIKEHLIMVIGISAAIILLIIYLIANSIKKNKLD